MRILIHSNAPWLPTGYGYQTRLLMEQLRRAGDDVAVSAYAGATGADLTWRGYKILPHGQRPFGVDVLPHHIQRYEADVTLLLMDLWMLQIPPDVLRSFELAAWLPIDCHPMSRPDLAVMTNGGIKPIAMSRFGESQLAVELGGTGNVAYAPHSVNTNQFTPMSDRDAYRRELELDDHFVIGICAANKDNLRKAWPEQFAAFARFHRKHPDTTLLVHTIAQCVGGLDLYELAADMDILHATRFTEPYVQVSGLMDTQMMRRWYSACDVVSLCSRAEGFGVPLIEAQACGTPVITTDASAMSELAGPGWLVKSEPFWNPVHRAWWATPWIEDITRAYLSAYNHAHERRDRAREFALRYDVEQVFETHWEPILKEYR